MIDDLMDLLVILAVATLASAGVLVLIGLAIKLWVSL